MQGFHQALQELPSVDLVTGIVRAVKQEFQYHQVVPDINVVSVSDGTGRLTAHGCAAHDFIASQVQLFAAALDEFGNEFEIFHVLEF